ncbi:pyrroline-5-carboxylate reductase [Rossellomorea aquimaris]|uniref:Pyrroline-5-carboxylate reductase n=1 Tax=Rossellomorea aquimaris TaxID=189382 RepID=A0A1J6WI68_9BACI|nr:pyrroline-5-carboxylate reductase [Rossellomorea aquimaris]OIU71544.1 pyrroline-5-carboxylate reductase [Rossellomorea aquimaris]
MEKTIGFIGCGNMAQAILGGILKADIVDRSAVMTSARSDATRKKVAEEFQVECTEDNLTVAGFSDILFLSIKPDQYEKVIAEIKDEVKEDVIIVTIAAGITLDWVEARFDKAVKVVRTMPNTPSLVGEGMTAYCMNNRLTQEELKEVSTILGSFGKAEAVEESLMDAIPAVSGSSPAYVFMFIEALADGAVLQGLPRKQAYEMAAQAVLGAAKMVLETGTHPGELKDAVCSPGGATIEAVAALEKNGFKGSILAAMEACGRKSTSLGG